MNWFRFDKNERKNIQRKTNENWSPDRKKNEWSHDAFLNHILLSIFIEFVDLVVSFLDNFFSFFLIQLDRIYWRNSIYSLWLTKTLRIWMVFSISMII